MLCLLSALSLCLWRVGCKYALISRFKGVFRGFYGADVYLYELRSLRGLWGFCVREWLGGLEACGVFAFLFVLLSLCLLCFYLCAYLLGFAFVTLCLSSLLALFVLVSLWVLFLFPFRTKRKRAHLFCALSLLGFGVFILSYLRQ